MHQHRLNRLAATVSLIGALACASLLAAGLAHAAPRAVTYFPAAVVDATASSTFATTSYADLPGAAVSFTPQVDPNATEAPGTPIPQDVILVEFNADVSKATATTGTCAPYVNGAVVTKFARSVSSSAGQATLTIIAPVPNTTTGSQTVKIQCKSGDTNTFTVNNGVLSVAERF